jgi:hypothetical protein
MDKVDLFLASLAQELLHLVTATGKGGRNGREGWGGWRGCQFNKSMATLVAEPNTTGVLVTAALTSQLCLKRLAAFTAELHAFRIISLTLWTLHD